MTRLALILALALAAPAEARVIRNNGGGNAWLILQDRLASLDERIVIDGPCVSACTMYLTMPHTCITERAQLGFHHGATEHADFLMLPTYTPELQQWFFRNVKDQTIVWMDADTARRFFREC